MKRRTVLQGAAALGLVHPLCALATPRNADGLIDLRAAPGKAVLMGEEGGPADIWAYGPTAPGPELRFKRGERVRIRLSNALPQPTTVHWHGIRIDNAMDGVAGLTQTPVPPGETFDYEFTVPDAGTYWYHPHNRSWEQLARGLYGALIVEEDEPYPVDRELTLVLDDWRLTEAGALHESSFGDMHDWSHSGRLGNWVTINGASTPSLEVKHGERLRLRLINASNARTLQLVFGAVSPTIVALDGQPLSSPRRLEDAQPLVLTSAQRADLIVDVSDDIGASSELLALSGREHVVIGRFAVTGRDESGKAGSDVEALPSNGLPEPDLANAISVDMRMEGGAMGAMRTAMYQGAELSIRELVAQGQVWAFNGVVGRTEKPLFDVQRGGTVMVNLLNDTAWPHAMHFHGHHVRPVRSSNAKRLLGDLRDTVLVQRGESLAVALVADNPGKWMLHCHMLEHQASGMATWFAVT